MSSVQFNLLPDVKVDYAKTQASQGRVVKLAILVSVVAVALLIILFIGVDGLQKKQLSDANGQVNAQAASLQSVPNLSKILTVQNQLTTLSGLHQNKHITSRLFSYFASLTPAQANLGQLTLDMTNNTLVISGTADSQQTVNTFIDTLKFAQYKVGASGSAFTAFSSVIESAFNINSANVSYTLNVQFDPKLFANNLTDSSGKITAPQLVIKNQTTTRSAIDDPGNSLFNGQTGGGGQ